MNNGNLDIPAGLRVVVEQALKTAVAEALAGMNVLDLKSCQEELQKTRHALADMQMAFEVWQELARRRGEENERLSGQIEVMHNEMVEMNTKIALLQSALENRNDE